MSSKLSELASQYDPAQVEKRIYEFWEKAGVFTPDLKSEKPAYVITMPPPNVTGILHMGHALMCTIEDILIRWKRMKGFNTLWVPGTDHAGIATQMVVERNIMKEQKLSKHDLGREKFEKKVWEWKELSQGTILGQMRLIGCSADWTRLAFTLDAGVSEAVKECFKRLYDDGLIYRGEAMIQWCPRCRTALSDLEVKPKEVKGKIWHIKYLFKDNPTEGVVVATTRPETLLGDVAVAVHPDDERYQKFVGKMVMLPLANREIPIIADSYVDPAFGTGALKITPAHDANDFQVGMRHKLPIISIFDDRAYLNEQAGPYQGLSREDARERALKELTEQNLLVKEEAHTNNVGHCDRCSTRVEPRLSKQWFVKADVLAKEAIRVVEEKEIKIIPQEWEKVYFEWMTNIRPWCISRQLWWGHRIPAWHCLDCSHITVSTGEPTQCEKCQSKNVRQDDDVLDTWFSSGLWPFSTLGWPKDTKDMKKFYPTDVMETGFDILFFWVARMIMLGLRMTGKIPFHTIYLHPMVRDEYGQKMSKTKGNVKDPLDLINRMGADSLRFTLASMTVHGRDVLLSDSRIEGYRNFVNKLWNASRFVGLHFSSVEKSSIDTENEVNLWILARLNRARQEMNEAFEEFRFFEAANRIYHFVWSEFCDWFLELVKSPEEMEWRKAKKDSTAIFVLEEILKLLHPVMPFVTEEIWGQLPIKESAKCLALATFPEFQEKDRHDKAEERIGRMIKVVDAIRSKRGENNLAPTDAIEVAIVAKSEVLIELKPFNDLITKMVRSSNTTYRETRTDASGQVIIPLDDLEILIPREDLVDVAEEKDRVEKELAGVRGELLRADQKLANPEFANKAPADVIDGVRSRRLVLLNKVSALETYLKDLNP